jgi:hypothetical protein
LIGVLVALVVVPERQDTTRVVSPGGAASVAPGSDDDDGTFTDDGVADASSSSGATGSGTGSRTGTATGVVGGAGTGGAGSSTAEAGGGATARGVTASKIRIGIAEPDIQALRSLGPRYNQGNVQEQIASVLEGWKRDGKVPVNGREIEFVFRRYQLLVAEEQRAACVNLVQQDKVFAVAAPYQFGVGSECVAREQQTALVVTDEQQDDVYKRAPLLFSIYPSQGRALRNVPHWAHSEGLLKGKKIGIYYTQRGKALYDQYFTPQLKKLGYDYTVEATRARPEGGPEDSLAVQRMKTAGVDVVFIGGDPAEATPAPTSRAGTFPDQAESQDFHPLYITQPIQLGTGDTANSNQNQSQWDGARSMVYLRHGERGAGLTFEAPTEKCISDFERHTGRKFARTGVAPNAEEASLLQVCDVLNVILEGIRRAGPGLTTQTLVAGLEGIRVLNMASSAPISYGPGLHAGVSQYRSWRWDSPCVCGKVVGSPAWRPLPIL